MKRFTLLLILPIVFGLSANAGDSQLAKRQIATEPVLSTGYSIPEIVPQPRLSMDPSTGDTIGQANYDYGWNNGSRKMVESYFPSMNNGTHAHFTFMQRVTGGTRRQSYVYYNGTTYTPFVNVSTGASGFGDVNVYRGGLADGFAIVSYHTPRFIAINDAPGGTNFTSVGLTVANGGEPRPVAGSALDPTTGSRAETLYVLNTGDGRTDLWLTRTIDFGTSFTFLDSLLRYSPFVPADFTLDPPFQVRPNGDMYVFSILAGDGELPPIGTGTPDSCDRLGYFKSTTGGTSWTWTTVARDGEALLASAPSTFFIPENFGQVDGLVDASGVVHMVFNGYAIDTALTGPQATYRTMYWNSSSNTFVNVSRTADVSGAFNGEGRRSGNALGRCYPTIAYDATSGAIFVAWSEPQITGSAVDTSADGRWYYDVWYNWSGNSGATWAGPTRLTNSAATSELFTTLDMRLSPHPTDAQKRRAHMVYLADRNNGCFVFGEGAGGLESWVYRTVDVTVSSVREIGGLPTAFTLDQNYPNPFNPSTKIHFGVPKEELVTLKVYNMLGQEVQTLVNEVRRPGNYEVTFDAASLPSGVYFYKLSAGSFVNTKKMVLMK